MSDHQEEGFAPVRFENETSFIIAGMGERYTQQTNSGIPALWDKFAPHIGMVSGQMGAETYGVCCNPDGKGSFEYIAGVRVSTTKGLPEAFRVIVIEAKRYAVFEHRALFPVSAKRSRRLAQTGCRVPESRQPMRRSSSATVRTSIPTPAAER
jgi:AraC family transcriptional regulator